MRGFAAIVASWLSFWSGTAVHVEQASVLPLPPRTVRALLETFAINTHFQQGGQYSEVQKSVDALHDLGITQVRDSFTGLGHPGMEYAAQHGIKFLFTINAGWGMGVIGALEKWERAYPGSILAIEGPNEVNNWPVNYAGTTGIPAAQAFQNDLFTAVHASPLLSRIPVVALTSWPVFENSSNVGNVHAYARSGTFVSPEIRNGLADEISRNPPAKPTWLTEVGYHTHLGSADHDEGVSESVQAKMVLSAYLDAFEQGTEKTFLYQLEDQYDDPGDEQSHFGLIDREWRRKPAFHGLKNIIELLNRWSGQPSTRAAPSYELQALPASAHHMMLAGRDGRWMLAVWNEPALWDNKAKVETNVPPTRVRLQLKQKSAEIALVDPLVSGDPAQTVRNTNSFEFALIDHPIFISVETDAN